MRASSSLLGHAGDLLRFLIVSGTVLVLLRPLRTTVQSAASAPTVWRMSWRLLAVHAWLYIGFLISIGSALGDLQSPLGLSLGENTALAAALGAGAAATLLLPSFGRESLYRMARQAAGPLFVAAAVGLVTVWSTELSSLSWRPLSTSTFALVAGLLDAFGVAASSDTANLVIGIDHFSVQIAPICSGQEGHIIVLLLTGSYLWTRRKELRMPRSLIALPVGLACVWFLNGVRIAALLAIGRWISPDVAVSGFHSVAGWILFCGASCLIVGWLHHSKWCLRESVERIKEPVSEKERDESTALLVPIIVLLSMNLLVEATSSGFAYLLPVAVLVTAVPLVRMRHHYRSLNLRPCGLSVGTGLAVAAIWIPLESLQQPAGPPAEMLQMPVWLAGGWIAFRILGMVLVIPLCEELAFRGYLLRRLVSPAFHEVCLRNVGIVAVLLSSFTFGMLHSQWLGGIVAGLAYAWLAIRKDNVGAAVVGHAVTNAATTTIALLSGNWALWS